jgi:hypothetical protein
MAVMKAFTIEYVMTNCQSQPRVLGVILIQFLSSTGNYTFQIYRHKFCSDLGQFKFVSAAVAM